ncbi:MAG: hypothetical protein WAQ52_13570 [Terriglobales bacterium]
MQISNSRVLQVGGLMFVITALALSAQASFSNASLKGGYSFLTNRWTADVNTNEDAVVGVMTFDGAGNVTASFTAISGGVVQTGTASGTYTVNANGTGAINFTTGTNPPVFAITLSSTAAGLAHGVQLLRTDTTGRNLVESGTALLQSTTARTYSLASVKGKLILQLNDWTADATRSEDGIVGVGIFDGKGTVKGSFTGMSGGVLSTGSITGTYTVNADGSGSMSLTAGTGTPVLAFALNNATPTGPAKGLQLLQTNTSGNIVISGIALKQ